MGKGLIKARGAKVFLNLLQGVGKRFGNSAGRPGRGQRLRTVGHGPQSQQRLYARDCAGSRIAVRHNREITQAKMLAEAFVVCEEEAFVLFDRPAQRAAKHVALKLWNRPVIEKVSSIECAVAQEFEIGRASCRERV